MLKKLLLLLVVMLPCVCFAVSGKGYIETKKITFQTLNNGVNVHVADYGAEVYIVTALNGIDKGDQMILNHGEIVAYTSDKKSTKKYFVHYYEDGNVKTYKNKQIMSFGR